MPKLETALREPLHDALRAGPNFDSMTDDEVMAFLSSQTEADKFAIPRGLEPDGMKYQWMAQEVVGKPNYKRMSEATMNGWQPVPASRHDGLYMPPGAQGQIVVEGMALFEIPERVYRIKRELAAKAARGAVASMNEQLVYAPPGTAPRDAHAKTVPVVRQQSGVQEIMVE